MTTNSTHIALICAVAIMCFGLYQGYTIEQILMLAATFLAYAGIREQQRVSLTKKINEARVKKD